MDVLRNCSTENGITIETYIQSSRARNTDAAFTKIKCVDACMFKIYKIVSPYIV
jgi:hypothetical protein